MAGSVTDALNEVYKVAAEYGIDLSEQVGDAEDVQIKALAWFAANMPDILNLTEYEEDEEEEELIYGKKAGMYDTMEEKEMD